MNNFEEIVEKYLVLDKRKLAELLAINDLFYVNTPKVCPPYGFKPNWFPTWTQNHTEFDGFITTACTVECSDPDNIFYN